MVKRQTVWLSTMMVLSLMLIGYYTMNNGAPGTGGVTTTTVTPPTDTTGTASTGGDNNVSQQPAASSSDWFVVQQTNVSSTINTKQDAAMKLMDNNNATSDQIAAAQQEMNDLQNQLLGIQTAQTALQSEGYSNCAVVPSSDGKTMTVWVQAKSLTALKAAQILDTVSQYTSVAPEEIRVNVHS